MDDAQYAAHRPFDRLFQVGIVVNNTRTLSTQFKSDILQIRFRSRFLNFTPRESRARERDFINIHVLCNSLADSGSISDYDIDDTGRKASLFDELAYTKGAERSKF